MRLRRYLLHQKAVKSKESNLILTNNVLENMNLKSLLKVKEGFDSSLEGRRFSKKIIQKKPKKQAKQTQNWLSKNYSDWAQLEGKAMYYQQKLILRQLKEVTSSLKKIERRLSKLE
jgi:hypothetical protein